MVSSFIPYAPLQAPIYQKNIYSFMTAPNFLQHIIYGYWQICPQQDKKIYRALPDNCVDIIFDLADLKTIYITPPFTQIMEFPIRASSQSQKAGYFGIRFAPLGQYHLSVPPLSAWNVTQDMIDIADFLPKTLLPSLYNILSKPYDFKGICWKLSKIFHESATTCYPDPNLLHFLQTSCQFPYADQRLTDLYDCHPRQLRRLCQQYFALSPREIQQILRFQATCRDFIYTRHAPHFWPEYYYDQSHLYRHFKKITGMTPRAFQSMSALYNPA